MMDIEKIATIIRCKNAKPFLLTMDIFIDTPANYEKVKKSGVISKKLIADLYHLHDEDEAEITNFDQGRAIKITIPRQVPSGNVGDTDVYGAQHHVPLYTIKIPW